MDSRIQQVLDGELARSELTEAELAVLGEAEAAITGALRAIPVRPLPGLRATVMERIEVESAAPHRSSLKAAFAWLWQPRPFPVRWRAAYALPVAAALAFMLWPGRQDRPHVPAAPARVLVEFRLAAPQATHVALAGGFTNWQPTHTLVQREPGIWTIVVPLAPGVHDYAFIINGERWIPDPLAPAIDDGFGGLNSRVAVLPPEITERS